MYGYSSSYDHFSLTLNNFENLTIIVINIYMHSYTTAHLAAGSSGNSVTGKYQMTAGTDAMSVNAKP